MAQVNWDMICYPKKFGGLVIRRINLLNKALISKMRWNLSLHKNNGSSIMSVKYLNLKKLYRDRSTSRYLNGSIIWNNILKSIGLIYMGPKWKIGNGLLIRFQEGKWLKDMPFDIHPNFRDIRERAQAFFRTLVSEYISPHSSWRDITKYCQNQPHLLQKASLLQQFIQIIKILLFLRDDKFLQTKNPKGNFLIRSTYNLLLKEGGYLRLWQKVWNPQILP